MSTSTATVALLLTAKDLASKEVNKTSKSLRDLKSGALDGLGIGFLGVAGAAAALTGVLVKGVKGAMDEQVGIQRLGQVLKANVANWDGNTDAIERTISSRTNLGFADDELRASLAKLVPATHDVNKAFAIQTTAMDLARLKGISLDDASQALVKVEAGQYRALKDLGIVLRDGATQTEALAAVQKVAQGQAAAYMETTAGKAELLGKKFDDLTENVGTLLLPTLDDLVTRLTNVTEAMDSNSPKNMADRIMDLAGAFAFIVPGAKTATDYYNANRDALNGVSKKAMDAALSMDTYSEKNADARDPTIHLTTASNNLSRALKLVAQNGNDAAAAVQDEIDAMTESNWINGQGQRNPKPETSSYRQTPGRHRREQGSHNRKPRHHIAGGWVGLGGPEMVTVGENGPEYVVPASQASRSAGGVTIQGVTESQLMDMVDRQMYFRLRRAGTGR